MATAATNGLREEEEEGDGEGEGQEREAQLDHEPNPSLAPGLGDHVLGSGDHVLVSANPSVEMEEETNIDMVTSESVAAARTPPPD